MSHQIEITNAGGHLQITFSGPFSPDGAKESIDAMVNACAKEGCPKVLFDCRPMTGDPTVSDRFETGTYGASKIPGHVKIAMLGRGDQISADNFFETVARNRGVNITVFTETDAALEWLKK
jgi:hypothetical protein